MLICCVIALLFCITGNAKVPYIPKIINYSVSDYKAGNQNWAVSQGPGGKMYIGNNHLQSIWFIPHVTVYMFSYSVLGCAFIIALTGLFRHKEEYLHTADNLVYAGIAFLSIGMLLGSLWAKEAWGNYWSWDPKETWAVITWAGYLLYVHLRLFRKTGRKTLYVLLIMSFLALQMCWYGVNYLPAAQQSVHLYNRNN